MNTYPDVTFGGYLKFGALKAMIDGSLGSHTAAMIDDYDDTPNYKGYLLWSTERLRKLIKEADLAGLQVMVHAIGDLGMRQVLNVFESVFRENPPRDRRYRIEHAQHVHPTDLPRVGALGLIASMQPEHHADDGRWCCRSIGKRIQTSWPLRSFIETGSIPALGSDWFVTLPDPLHGIYYAVTRQTKDGGHPNGLVPEEAVTVEIALRGYTVHAAYSGFDEGNRGTLQVGKLADITILDQNILCLKNPQDLLKTHVTHTIVGGRVVYERKVDE
jgi:predicted amidohydrolase YtcJ